MKKPQPARVKKLDQQMPLKATRLGVGEPEAKPKRIVPGQTDQNTQLKNLRDSLKAENSGKNDAARANKDRIKHTLEQIRTKFGDEAYRKAVEDFRADFREFDKINLLKNKGPGIRPENNLQPPPS